MRITLLPNSRVLESASNNSLHNGLTSRMFQINISLLGWIAVLFPVLSVSLGCSGLHRLTPKNLAKRPVVTSSELATRAAAAETPPESALPTQDQPTAPQAVVLPASCQADLASSSCWNGPHCMSGACGAEHCGSAAPTAGDCFSSECECWTNCDPRGLDPQEHLFDGGDLEPRAVVRRDDWTASGINSTDTVAYYETAGGKVCIQPTNRVAIYAPRFGAVRQVTGAVSSNSALAPGGMIAPLAAGGINDLNRADGLVLSAGPLAKRQIQQLDRFRDDKRMVKVTSVIPPTPVSDAVAALINVDVSAVDLAAIRETTLEESKAVLIETTWLPESLSIMMGGQPALVLVGTKQAAEVLLYETPDGCSLRITKSASHTMANTGDVVRFTLRFENTGPNEIDKVVIADSLSPRLEYIGGSQLCSLQARFSAQPNASGSAKLEWELVLPLEANAEGVISFDCRVR